MPPSRFGQVSRYRNATLSTGKPQERFSELGLGALPDNGGGRQVVVTAASGHIVARSASSNNALLTLPPDAPRKYAKQPPILHGVCSGSLADFDVARFQPTDEQALLAVGSSSGSLSVRRISLPASDKGASASGPAVSSDDEVVFSEAAGGGPVTAVKFHPLSQPVVATASNSTSKIQVYDVASSSGSTSSPVLEWDATSPQWDVAWNVNGAQIAGAGKDLNVRIWDARQRQSVASFAAHASKVKSAKVTFITNAASHLLLTTGFSQMRQREIAIWDQRKSTSPLKRIALDVASSGLDPVCEHDRGIVYLTAKGDSSIRWIDVGSQDQGPDFAEGAYPLDFSASSAALGPSYDVDTSKGEIARLFVATATSSGGASSSDAIVPCSVQVPRRNYIDFHADLYPETSDRRSNGLSAPSWLAGDESILPTLSLDPQARSLQTAKAAPPPTASSEVKDTQATQKDEPAQMGASRDIGEPPSAPIEQSAPSHLSQKSETERAGPSSSTMGSRGAESARPSAVSSLKSNGIASPASRPPPSKAPNAHWSRKPMAGSTPLIPAHQNLAHLDLSRGPDARMIAASRQYFFIPLDGPGGRLGVHPISAQGRMPFHLPAFVHGSTLVDFAVDPFSDEQVFTIGQDGVIKQWRVPELRKDDDGILSVPTLDSEKPIAETALTGVSKIAKIVPHPYVGGLIAILPSDEGGQFMLVDAAAASVVATLETPGKGCYDAAWSPDGSVLALAGKDKELHIVDVRSSTTQARSLGSTSAHDSSRSFTVLWLDERHLMTVGHTVGSMRQLTVYRIDPGTGELSTTAKHNMDASPSVLFPVWDADTSILWLWSKGERIVSAFEIQPEGKEVFTTLPAFQHGQPQLGLAFLPKDCVDVPKVELGKAIRLSKTELQHVAWNVPRSRPEFFQDDVYPPTVMVRQPLLDVGAWMSGRDARSVPRESLQPDDMTALSQAPPPQTRQSSLAKGPTIRQMTAKEREDQALQNVFEKAKGRDEGKDPNHNEDQAARAPGNDDWSDSD